MSVTQIMIYAALSVLAGIIGGIDGVRFFREVQIDVQTVEASDVVIIFILTSLAAAVLWPFYLIGWAEAWLWFGRPTKNRF